MYYKLLILLVIGLSALTSSVHANTNSVVTWVDDDGVTHFGNPQFAPSSGANEVQLQRANGMQVPKGAESISVRKGGSRVVTLNKAARKNKRGFRGYNARPKNRSRSRRR